MVRGFAFSLRALDPPWAWRTVFAGKPNIKYVRTTPLYKITKGLRRLSVRLLLRPQRLRAFFRTEEAFPALIYVDYRLISSKWLFTVETTASNISRFCFTRESCRFP